MDFRDIDENLVREVCSEVAEWYTQAAVGDSFTILKNDGRAQRYIYTVTNCSCICLIDDLLEIIQSLRIINSEITVWS